MFSYTGFCPQYKYRIGDTYGSTTHKLLLDPTVSHAEKLIISDRSRDDYDVNYNLILSPRSSQIYY